jgi:hypothetical protein
MYLLFTAVLTSRCAAGTGSAVYDVEYAVNIYAKCTPYLPIGDEFVLDEEYKCGAGNRENGSKSGVIV